jgi:spermidine/putrescine transport system permease protein
MRGLGAAGDRARRPLTGAENAVTTDHLDPASRTRHDSGTVAPPRSAPARAWPLVLPTWLLLGVCVLVPLGLLVWISLHARGTYGGVQPVADWGAHLASGGAFAQYLRSLDPLYLGIAWRSVWMAAVTTLLCALIGYPVAAWLALAAPARWKGLLLGLVVVPFWTSFLVRTYAWMFLLRSEGLFNRLLQGAGLTDRPLQLLFTEGAVLVGLVYGELPFLILPVYASLEKLDRTLLEAAADLGAGRAATFRRVTLPLSLPGLAAGGVLVFIPSLGQFVVSDLLGGARSALLGNLVQNQFAVARNPPFGAALALELVAAVLLLVAVYALAMRGRGGEALP